jgi:hypothetical protein
MDTEIKAGGTAKRLATDSAIVLSFVVALEFVIMISPFAFVFYAAMNPFLLALNQSVLTRWLTAFFLPHMVVPPNAFLEAVRVLGSVMAGMTHHDPSLHNSALMKRRIIFLDLSADQRPLAGPEEDFGINVRRAPLFFVDVHPHTAEVLEVHDLASGSGWGTVPTPLF